MDLENELSNTITAELARELILEDNGSIDDRLFQIVMKHITGEAGSGNAFDAPILYAMLKGKL